MPRAATACSVAGCVQPAVRGRASCASHARRLDGTPWRNLAAQKRMQAGGRCERPGCGRPARNVHHRDRVERTGRNIVPLDRLELLCDDCAAEADNVFAPIAAR